MTSPAAAEQFEIGPYRPGDEADLLACLALAFRFEPDATKWRHLYLENPAGEPIIVLARDRGTVVGHVGMLPRHIRAFGEETLAAHSIDGGVHPAWRRRGLRTALGLAARRIARARGAVVTYGVSNEQATHGILKYEERRYLGPLPVLVRPVRPLAAGVGLTRSILGRRRHGGSEWDPGDIVDCAVAGPLPDDGRLAATAPTLSSAWTPPAFDERHTRLFSDVEGVASIAIVRDAAYLAWRYRAGAPSPYRQRDAPERDGLAATVVIRAAELSQVRLVFVMEWHWCAGARRAARGLLRDVIRLARALGAHGVAAMATPGTPHRQILWRLGFLPVPEWLFGKTSVMSVRPERDDVDVRRWTERRNWYLTWGDGLIL